MNVADHSRVNPGPGRYRNGIITQRRTGPCGLYRHCVYNDNSNIEMYIAMTFILKHYYTFWTTLVCSKEKRNMEEQKTRRYASTES